MTILIFAIYKADCGFFGSAPDGIVEVTYSPLAHNTRAREVKILFFLTSELEATTYIQIYHSLSIYCRPVFLA